MPTFRPTLVALFLALLITFTFLAPEARAAEPTDNFVPPKLLLKKIARYYQDQLNDATEPYFQNFPDLEREHTKKLKTYISENYPLGAFTADVLPSTDPAPYRRAQKEFFYRHGKAFEKTFQKDASEKWLGFTGYRMIQLRGIYVSQFIEKDPFKEELYESCKTNWEVRMVASISWEYPVDKLAEWTKEFRSIQDGDRFFLYSVSFWIDGVEGIFQVRDHQIVDSVTTLPDQRDIP